MWIRRILAGIGLVAVAGVAAYAGYISWLGIDGSRPSVCRGNPSTGSLEGGRRLPYSGDNYRAYSLILYAAGRTFVHSAVRDTMRDAYAELARSRPELRFVYAETGWPWGGRFPPHKTHANGTSVDFHVPVRTEDGTVAELPTSLFNQYGYSVRFDRNGGYSVLKLDFEAMGEHLLALEKAARAHGIRIRRVIFDIHLQPKLAAAKTGAAAMARLAFSKTQAWVPHSEHYHVDFEVGCR
ncbi:MAG: penicillin-insensitive murein endopeptidase [Hyphomicrobiaceae bacterium]